MSETKILGFAGSARSQSYNKLLVRCALRGAETAGVSCSFVDLRDYPLPLYDGDLEESEGIPSEAVALAELFAAQDGLLIAAPEYNGSITPLLKNTIDWVSRILTVRNDLNPYRGKVAAIMSASPGALGGIRGLVVLRALLTNLGVTVLPEQITVRDAGKQFSASGGLLDESLARRVEALGAQLATVAGKLSRD